MKTNPLDQRHLIWSIQSYSWNHPLLVILRSTVKEPFLQAWMLPCVGKGLNDTKNKMMHLHLMLLWRTPLFLLAYYIFTSVPSVDAREVFQQLNKLSEHSSASCPSPLSCILPEQWKGLHKPHQGQVEKLKAISSGTSSSVLLAECRGRKNTVYDIMYTATINATEHHSAFPMALTQSCLHSVFPLEHDHSLWSLIHSCTPIYSQAKY